MKSIRVNRLVLLMISGIVFVLGCGSPITSMEQFNEWLNEESNGFIKKKTIGPFLYTASYRTPEMMKLIQKRNSGSGVDTLSYEGSHYVIFEISGSSESSGKNFIQDISKTMGEYTEFSYEMAFGLESDFMLIDGNDTLLPSFYHHEPGYELMYGHRMIMAFPRENSHENSLTLIYNDRLFNTGRSKFSFEPILPVINL